MRDLSKYDKSKVKIKNGFYPKYTFDVDGKKYFFKLNVFDKHTNKFMQQDIIEVFSSDFYDAVGFKNYVKYDFATCGKDKGCCCESYFTNNSVYDIDLLNIMMLNYCNKKDETIYSITNGLVNRDMQDFYEDIENRFSTDGICDFPQYLYSKQEILDEVKAFCETYDIKISKEMDSQLNKMIVLDYFSCNTDRNWQNIKFLVKDKDNPYMEMTPLFDNGYNFGLRFFYTERVPQDSMFLSYVGFSDIGAHNNLEYSKLLKNGKLIASDIFELCKKDKEIKTLVDNILNVNIEQLLQKFIIKNKQELPEEISNKICDYFNHRKEQYIKTASRIEKKLNNKYLEK